MAALPGGTVTFLLTDVEGSTRLWEDDRTVMAQAVAELDELVARIVRAAGGEVVKPRGEGDSHFCVFTGAAAAAEAAVALQEALAARSLRVRASIHTGEAELREADYYGPVVNRAARLRAIAHGGQTVVSGATVELLAASLPAGAELVDRGHHRLRDLSEPEHVFELRDASTPSFPPLRSLDVARHNLPVQLSSFIGREEDVATVRSHLTQQRLVTLTGAGGSGKTRLAVQAAAECVDVFGDGVWFVDLAPLSDPDGVPAAVAEALGLLPEQGGTRTAREDLLERLRGKDLLTIFDNCEHLIAETAELATAILKIAKGVRILATSREALGVEGEAIWLVPSLALPDEGEDLSILRERASVRLFVERAAMKRPGYELTERDAPAVTQICRRLDGIPLAVELAAGRMAVLSAEQIAGRLDDRFRLLTGGGRSAMARQQTLLAAIDWSYDLLDSDEQALLRRLSVFAGGCDLEAIEAVCADDFVPDPLDAIGQLVAKSLVVVDVAADGARYRLLETIRQYAAAKLLDSGETATLRDRQQAWVADLARAIAPDLRGPRQREAIDRVDVELENIRAALAWASPANAEVRVGILDDLFFSWSARARWPEAIRYARAAIDDLPGTASVDVRVVAYSCLARLIGGVGESAEVRLWAEQCAALEPEVTPSLAWHCSFACSIVAKVLEREEPDEGRVWSDRSVRIARDFPTQDSVRSTLLYHRAGYLLRNGPAQEGLALFEESVDLARRAGAPNVIIRSVAELALHAALSGDDAAADRLWAEAEDAARGLGFKSVVADTLECRAGVRGRQGDLEGARRMFADADALWDEVGLPAKTARELNYAGYARLAANDFEGADACFEEAIEVARRDGDQRALAEVIHSRGEGRLLATDLEAAERWLAEAEALARACEPPFREALHDLGTVAVRRGDLPLAARRYREALGPDVNRERLRARLKSLFDIAALASAAGDDGLGRRLLGAAFGLDGSDVWGVSSFGTQRFLQATTEAREQDPDAFAAGQQLSVAEALVEAAAYCERLASPPEGVVTPQP